LEDLQSVEAAFSDLHRRYEKTKSVIEAYKKVRVLIFQATLVKFICIFYNFMW